MKKVPIKHKIRDTIDIDYLIIVLQTIIVPVTHFLNVYAGAGGSAGIHVGPARVAIASEIP